MEPEPGAKGLRELVAAPCLMFLEGSLRARVASGPGAQRAEPGLRVAFASAPSLCEQKPATSPLRLADLVKCLPAPRSKEGPKGRHRPFLEEAQGSFPGKHPH